MSSPPPSPLAELNAHIERVSPAGRELRSVARFRAAWDRGRTLDRLQQALERKPANAGPLNSHALVLRTLALMQDLSTDYLRRFIVQVETLQWLESAREADPRESAKPAARPKRSARARK